MRTVRCLIVSVVLLGVWPGLGTLRGQQPTRAETPRLKVAATIFPLYDLVRHVAEPAAEVVLLIPPGASEHTFMAKPSQSRALMGSTVLFAIGHGLDDWAVRMARDLGVAETLVVDAQIPLRAASADGHLAHSTSGAHQHGAVDPHYWLAIPNAIHMVQTITETMQRLDPTAAEDYQRRATAYRAQLETADRTLRQQLAGCPRRAFAVFHPAFAYLAAAYDLQIVATFAPHPGREPTPRHVEHFLQQVRAHHLTVLFIEPQLPSGPLQSLARDLGVTLRELDPLGGIAERDSYLALMHFNATQLAAMLCQ
jgi:ABC-type Zn uptake system ZnuABC Zn-binding protein ZnuA